MAAVKNVLPMIEAEAGAFGARPHWGKLFTVPGSRVEPLYPELAKI